MDAATLVRRARERAGLSQRELARRARTSAAAVCLYERGERTPRSDTLARLIAATGDHLELVVRPAPDIDLEANGRVLRELLDLTDNLPRRHGPTLTMPPMHRLTER